MDRNDKKVKIPVLMYHEVSRETARSVQPYKMTPIYDISESQFKDQIAALHERGYKSIFFEEARSVEPDSKHVIITFDDGLIGNIRYALPILKKYGFKAAFYVAVGSVGTPRFMSWADLRELVDNGMSVQSHTVNHRSLETLNDREVMAELLESKKDLESRLGLDVTSISFPHGSYNKNILKLAVEAGYEFMCTSEMKLNYNTTFLEKRAVLGRITITSKLSVERFIKLVEYDNREVLRDKLTKSTKNIFKSIIGIRTYGKLYRTFFNIKT